MQMPDTSALFPEIPEGHLREAIITAWLDGYRTKTFELRIKEIEDCIAKLDSMIETTKGA